MPVYIVIDRDMIEQICMMLNITLIVFFFFNDKTEKKDKSGNFISSHPTENQVTTFISCGLFTGPRATIFLVETLNGRTLYFLSATCDVSLTQ